MTDNPWLNQPDVSPYPRCNEEEPMSDRPIDSLSNFIRMADGRHDLGAGALAERIAVDWLPEVLAEAERRGAERGWDEGRESVGRDFLNPLDDAGQRPASVNPYRRAS